MSERRNEVRKKRCRVIIGVFKTYLIWGSFFLYLYNPYDVVFERKMYKAGGRGGVASLMVHWEPSCAEKHIFPTQHYRGKSFGGVANLCTLIELISQLSLNVQLLRCTCIVTM